MFCTFVLSEYVFVLLLRPFFPELVMSTELLSFKHPSILLFNLLLWHGGGEVVKLLVCGARGPGFDSRSRRYDFRNWLSPATKSPYDRKTAQAT